MATHWDSSVVKYCSTLFEYNTPVKGSFVVYFYEHQLKKVQSVLKEHGQITLIPCKQPTETGSDLLRKFTPTPYPMDSTLDFRLKSAHVHCLYLLADRVSVHLQTHATTNIQTALLFNALPEIALSQLFSTDEWMSVGLETMQKNYQNDLCPELVVDYRDGHPETEKDQNMDLWAQLLRNNRSTRAITSDLDAYMEREFGETINWLPFGDPEGEQKFPLDI